MYCSQCGTEVPNDSAFCHRCGARVISIERDDAVTGAAVSAPAPRAATRRGHCERCGQELGVNEKMRGLTAHGNCPSRVSEAPPRAPAAEEKGAESRVHHGSAAGASGGPQAAAQSRPRWRLRLARTGLKWLPTLGGAVVGGALLVLYVLAADPGFHVTPDRGFVVTSDRVQVPVENALIVMTVACAFVGGITAGLWANWRGGTHGTFSGMIVGGGGYLYIVVQTGNALLDYSRSHLVGIVDIIPSSMLSIFFISAIPAAVAGALGGLLGERMRR